ncbi:MAG: peptide-methionine (R)-S-oxide reductase MsrB [Actinomycetota bacterium]|nr:peptide-methionine (R)-S-oxide reductase MsrB [Actinomycetota bacterium]
MARLGTIGEKISGLLGRRDDRPREVEKSEADWRQQLSPEQFQVLRRKSTERPFSGAYVHPRDGGQYRCAGCDAVLFRAASQFDSGTGWPSFSDVIPESVELRRDFSAGIPRTEALCKRCGGHLGHLFHDGPGPDRSRYCINSCALTLGHDDSGPTDFRPPRAT